MTQYEFYYFFLKPLLTLAGVIGFFTLSAFMVKRFYKVNSRKGLFKKASPVMVTNRIAIDRSTTLCTVEWRNREFLITTSNHGATLLGEHVQVDLRNRIERPSNQGRAKNKIAQILTQTADKSLG